MTMITFALASLLSMLAMLWLAATQWRRVADTGEAGTAPVEAVGLGLTLLCALGAVCAFGPPHLATAVFVVAAVLGITGGLLGDVADLIVLGAGALLPTATSVIRPRRFR